MALARLSSLCATGLLPALVEQRISCMHAHIVAHYALNQVAVCNLASLCLPRFVVDGKFDHDMLKEATEIITVNCKSHVTGLMRDKKHSYVRPCASVYKPCGGMPTKTKQHAHTVLYCACKSHAMRTSHSFGNMQAKTHTYAHAHTHWKL
jgi:hypothetical protein